MPVLLGNYLLLHCLALCPMDGHTGTTLVVTTVCETVMGIAHSRGSYCSVLYGLTWLLVAVPAPQLHGSEVCK
jgi:hypothetical protein